MLICLNRFVIITVTFGRPFVLSFCSVSLSFLQVLGSVKHKVDCYAYTLKDFDAMLATARQFLTWRDETYFGKAGATPRRESTASMPGSVAQPAEQKG